MDGKWPSDAHSGTHHTSAPGAQPGGADDGEVEHAAATGKEQETAKPPTDTTQDAATQQRPASAPHGEGPKS